MTRQIRKRLKWRQKRKCPIHNIKLVAQETRHGVRYACPHATCTVACWSGSTSTPADDTTRGARHQAHLAFDPLFKGKSRGMRAKVYAALASHMGLSQEETHIGYFDAEQCRRVIEFCEQYNKETANGKT